MSWQLTRTKNFNLFGVYVKKSIRRNSFKTVDSIQFRCKLWPPWARRRFWRWWRRRRLFRLVQFTGYGSRRWRNRNGDVAIGYDRAHTCTSWLFVVRSGRCPRVVHFLAQNFSGESIKRTENWHHRVLLDLNK